jgi:hypothetical protein
MNPPPRFINQVGQDGSSTYTTQETFAAAGWNNMFDPFPPHNFSFPQASPFANPTLTFPSVNPRASSSVPSQPAIGTEILQDVGPQPKATARRRRHDGQHSQYTDAIWSQHRPKIKELYMDQNLTLKQTMGKLKELHGFCPS